MKLNAMNAVMVMNEGRMCKNEVLILELAAFFFAAVAEADELVVVVDEEEPDGLVVLDDACDGPLTVWVILGAL